MSNCLKDYIGVKGFTSDPESGMFLNQLPGISLASIQKVADSEQVTFVQVYSDVQDRAWRRLVMDMRNRMRLKFKVRTNRTIFHMVTMDNGEIVTVSPHYRGLVTDSGFDFNGFFAFHVSTITIDLPDAHASLDIKLFDRSGHLLDTLTITNAVIGLNTITVKKDYAASRLFIAVDTTAVQLKDTVLSSQELSNYQLYMTSIFGIDAGIWGGESHLQTPWLIGNTLTTYGISASVMPICDYSAVICWNKELFTSAWLNLLGAELMIERIYSPRINKLTTVDAEKAEELRDLYTGLYENALDDTVDGLQISHEDACIECKQTITSVERLP